jgi:hypothetical protein
MCCTNCVGHPQVQYSVVFGTCILTSYVFSPRTSIYRRKAAIDSAFVCPLYRGRVGFNYRVPYIVTLYAFTAFFYRHFHLISAYLAMQVVDLYLCWWPPILCCRSGALPARHRFSAWCYSSSHISCSLSPTRRRRVS